MDIIVVFMKLVDNENEGQIDGDKLKVVLEVVVKNAEEEGVFFDLEGKNLGQYCQEFVKDMASNDKKFVTE